MCGVVQNQQIRYSQSGTLLTQARLYDYVAYLFADNPDGGIKCGSYEGTSAAGNAVDVGFKPGWVLVKAAGGTQFTSGDSSSSWWIVDSKRGDNKMLYPNLNEKENHWGNTNMELTDNGFTLNDSSVINNKVGTTFIYVAIADTTVRFYDENTNSTVTNHTLTRRYGVDPLETDLTKYGIFPLTEQPTYSVAAYVKEGDKYNPVRSYEGELNRANNRIAELQTSFEARIAALEADHAEMMDDTNNGGY